MEEIVLHPNESILLNPHESLTGGADSLRIRFGYAAAPVEPEPNNIIDAGMRLLSRYRKQWLSIPATYIRGDKTWDVIVSPGKPETPPLNFEDQAMFLNSTSLIFTAKQPPNHLQFVENGELIFEPKIGDLVRYTVGKITVTMKIVERGGAPRWNFLFGNREIKVYVERYRE